MVSICLSEKQAGLIQDLRSTKKEVENFQIKTRIQSSSPLWHKLRRGRITASNVGAIFRRKKCFQAAATTNINQEGSNWGYEERVGKGTRGSKHVQ